MFRNLACVLLIGGLGFASIGCQTKAGTGALVGGLGGAAIGGAIGSVSHSRSGAGALIGGAVGAIGGALVGNEMDKQDQKDRLRERREAERERAYAAPPPPPAPATPSNADTISKEQVIYWWSQGTKEDIIIDRIQRSKAVYRVTPADEQQMRDAGVSERVITVMRDPARRY